MDRTVVGLGLRPKIRGEEEDGKGVEEDKEGRRKGERGEEGEKKGMILVSYTYRVNPQIEPFDCRTRVSCLQVD